MDKNLFAPTPPMGWNSYDYYDTTVCEADVKANADYMAKHLKKHGWEYIIVDIAWYAHNSGTQREKHQYIPFDDVEMDEYSRLLPCPSRFPSAKNGAGFAPLADYVHGLGLKFGIHIMRGIPRIAAHTRTKILGTDKTANEIANAYSICKWNPDMYGLDTTLPESQAYYDSLMALYASWGVDFVKCDDICNYGKHAEIPMLHRAIEASGRDIVLSLSPGPAQVEAAWHYEKYANMWRITDDFWDSWPLLKNMFERCELWQNHVSAGCYPDCDMLPLGHVGKGFLEPRTTNFTKDEQVTMMTLWCIFRSPLMLGAELTRLDDETLSLITNDAVLRLLSHSHGARQIRRDENEAIWYSEDNDKQHAYVALFNLSDDTQNIRLLASELNVPSFPAQDAKNLWTNEALSVAGESLQMSVAPHGAVLFKISVL